MELVHKGEKIIAAVAQQPFSYDSNTFCKLIPLFSHYNKYDKLLDKNEFYNDGEIWWRISRSTNPRSITPGMMMEFFLEPAQEQHSEEAEKSLYQARFQGKEETIDPTAGAEIFSLPRETCKSIQRLKGDGDTIFLPHVPSKRIFLNVEGYVYGPFAAEASVLEEGSVSGNFKVRAALVINTKPELYRIRMSDFASRYNVARAQAEVALDQSGTRASNYLVKTSYEYLPPEECEKIENDFLRSWEALDWEPLSAKLKRMSGMVAGCSRSLRRDLGNVVKDIEENAGALGLPEEFASSINTVRKLAEDEEAAFRDLAIALMDCDYMKNDSRFKKVTDEYLKHYVENHKKELEQEYKDLDRDCEDLAKKIKDERARLEKERETRKLEEKRAKDRLRQDLDKQKSQAGKEIADARRKWEAEQGQLAAQLDEKRRYVEGVLEEIKAQSNKSAADCIALMPFLKELGFGGAQKVTVESAGSSAKVEPFEIPLLLSTPTASAKNSISQSEFLARLRDYAGSQGLSYDLNDLRRFHVSVLCEGLSVLEGPSGVGKSSLARIYGDVLAGTNQLAPRNGTHIVHVSPSWVERADLLGYVNTVTGEFSPSETGLFQRLAYAQADYKSNGGGSSMYPICLDEMNLAQVEHYFSDFMQIMELPEERRMLRCFAKEAVSSQAVFREYADIAVPPTVRFIGTVNFDETTKRLSTRLLDRVNLIYLNDNLRSRVTTPIGSVDAGQGVSAATYASWRKDAPLSSNVEKHLADLADPLRKLGLIVSPRVRSAMKRYIATSLPLLGSGEKAENIALDEQIAQRVLSKVRTITSLAQKKALDAVGEVIDGFRDDSASPSRAAIERLRAKEHFFGYENEF